MQKTKPPSRYFQGLHRTHTGLLVGELFSVLPEKGHCKALWQSPDFLQAYDLSKHIKKSASLLKKHLPPRYHEQVRFLQNAETWRLAVSDAQTIRQLVDILNNHYDKLMRGGQGAPQHVKLVRTYRDWEKNGELISVLKWHHDSPIYQLRQAIPVAIQDKIRVRYQPSVWQIRVEKSATATQLNWLLDELSMRIAKDLKFAPKLKVSVVPGNWKDSGFSIKDLTDEQKTRFSQREAEAYLADFLATPQKKAD